MLISCVFKHLNAHGICRQKGLGLEADLGEGDCVNMEGRPVQNV